LHFGGDIPVQFPTHARRHFQRAEANTDLSNAWEVRDEPLDALFLQCLRLIDSSGYV
jgi:hypothetical protein